MITIVTVWLYLISLVACDVVITVNNSGSDNDQCCVNGSCPCGNLSSALHDVSNNTVINITSELVNLSNNVGMGSGNLNNITITGNGATIMCNNTGGVYCESCSDITVMGITWYQCGCSHPEYPGFAFLGVSSEIIIQDCTFQNSSGCPVYIQNAKGNISITKSTFVGNVFNVSYHHFFCAGLYIYCISQVTLKVNNSRFDGNGCTSYESGDCGFNARTAMIYSLANNNNSVHNLVSFENTNFSNNSNGLYLNASVENTTIELLKVNVYNSSNGGIEIHMSRGTKTFAGTISVSLSTFIDNDDALSIIAVDESLINLSINIDSSAFNNTPNGISQSGITVKSHANSTSVNVSNSIFYNNQFGAVNIQINRPKDFLALMTSIVLTNVAIYNSTEIASNWLDVFPSIQIETWDTVAFIMFEKVSFTSNNFSSGSGITVNNHFTDPDPTHPLSIQLTNCTFDKNIAFDYLISVNIIMRENQEWFILPYEPNINITLSDCSFDHNLVGKSIVYINIPHTGISISSDVSIILDNSTFSNSKGTALHLIILKVQFQGNVLFINNSAINGAAVYMEEVYAILSDENANVQFVNNTAEQNGGAVYINLVIYINNFHICNELWDISNTSEVCFADNLAGIAGNSIYFNIPQTCQIITDTNNKSSLFYFPNRFNYSESLYIKHPPVVTSPYDIKLYPPAIAIHNSDNNEYSIQQPKMLGEAIQFSASVLDYFHNITEPVTFSINCRTCDNHSLSTYQITVHDHSIQELKIFPVVGNDVINNTKILITFLSALPPIYKSIDASLSVELSPCRAGYLFDNAQRQCICYPHFDLVHCKVDYVEIKIGYWLGFLTKHHYTSSTCPSNFCNSKHVESSPGFYSLHGKSDEQCNLHRTGVACGECKSGYTLAYDSPDCIDTEKCSAGITILVIVLTILYWIAIVALVFVLMYFQFQISSGYAYGIVYYYSIVDILLINNVSEDVFQLVAILSSFAKLTPQLFGQLCLVKGLSGIDQQFIHYSHAVAISLILLIIILVTRYSPRFTLFVGRCIIRVICLLLLLSYTSLASTSLQLLRPLTFNHVDEVRTYSSPDVKYFTGRHLVYAIVAMLCEVIIVIGLPLFLLLEPFLRQSVNFVRIKPLLDQFQGCYKDKYRWFAAYYLMCRQVIILIVYVGNGNYYYMLYGLQIACIIIAMIHGWLQPYKNNVLNGLDGFILLALVIVVSLNFFSLLPFILANCFSVVLVILPLLLLCFIAVGKKLSYVCNRKKRILHLYNPVEGYEENDNHNNEGR